MKSPIGLIIREIIDEKNLNISEVAQSMDMSRQNMYQVFSRKNMPKELLDKWAEVLGTTSEALTERQNLSMLKSRKSQDGGAFGDEILLRLLEEVKGLNEQLKVKDKQIGQLLDLLGKLKGICLRPFAEFSTFFFAVN